MRSLLDHAITYTDLAPEIKRGIFCISNVHPLMNIKDMVGVQRTPSVLVSKMCDDIAKRDAHGARVEDSNVLFGAEC